ncbi:MAG: amidohydrolase family protein [Chloroflexi bacterium]|nr:amidohydrolase family protein [Chloroflexota bacterium]
MIDSNAYVGEWPFRRLPHSQPDNLLRKMDSLGIEKAVVSRLENVFFKDLLVGNRELHEIAQAHPDRFIPAYTINPGYPGWDEDLEICLDELSAKNLRLHPNYHGYELLGQENLRLLEIAREHDLLVMIAIGLEDVRHHHRLVVVPDVGAGDIAQTVNAFPQVRFLVTGGRFGEVTSIWRSVDKRESLYVENSRVQGPIHDVAKLCSTIGPDHVLFGSNSPLHYHESAKLSIETESQIVDAVKQKLFHENAAGLFGA